MAARAGAGLQDGPATPRSSRDDSLAGGEALQLPLYILAAQQLLPKVRVESASYLYFTLRGGYRTVTFTRAALDAQRAALAGLLDTAADMIRERRFRAVRDARRLPPLRFPPDLRQRHPEIVRAETGGCPHGSVPRDQGERRMTQPVDHAAREAAANELDTTFFVEAAAGTGKTTSLVARIVSAIASGRARLREIVAITFTEKAAGELKMRLREKLEETLKDEALREALADLEQAHITTIHSFCAWVLRERPVEAVVDPQFAVADELQRQLLARRSVGRVARSRVGEEPAGAAAGADVRRGIGHASRVGRHCSSIIATVSRP